MRRLLALVCLSGCLFPELSGLTSDDAGGADAADATSDTFVPDVKTIDVSADVSDAGEAGKPSPCASPHTFCDDFDDGSLGATWTTLNNSGGVLAQSTNAISPPFAMEARVGAGGHPEVDLIKAFSQTAQHVHFECDLVIVGSQDAGMEIDYLYLGLTPEPPGFVAASFNAERNNPGGTLEEDTLANTADASEQYHDDSLTEDFHTWRHLAIDIDFTKSTVAMTVDGVSIDTLKMAPVLASAPITLSVGVTYAGGLASQWSVIVDNVVVDLN